MFLFSIRKKKCLGLTRYEQFNETVMEWFLASFNKIYKYGRTEISNPLTAYLFSAINKQNKFKPD